MFMNKGMVQMSMLYAIHKQGCWSHIPKIENIIYYISAKVLNTGTYFQWKNLGLDDLGLDDLHVPSQIGVYRHRPRNGYIYYVAG